MTRSDSGGLVALYAGLDEDDLYRRFFTAHAPPENFVEKMTEVAQYGGMGLVAVIRAADGSERIVAEATYAVLPDGDAELGITVAEDARGWLGPYLLDALVEEAAAAGIHNLHADVLIANRRMLAMLGARGLAFIEHEDQPATVRIVIGTTKRMPSWPGAHDRPRLLVEIPGGRWHAEAAAHTAGFQLLTCPGPTHQWSRCPALRGEPCPLAADADVIVDAQPGQPGRSLLEAHRRLHPSVPVCVELPADASDLDSDVAVIPQGADDRVALGLIQRIAKKVGAEADHHLGHEPS
jgi:RimJ/RimL family protein N-acetyltransferase